MRIAVCDDEKYFRDFIKELLYQYMKEKGTCYQIDTFDSGKKLLEHVDDIDKYQIIFLDINMDEIIWREAQKKVMHN